MTKGPNTSPLRILLADDDKDDRYFFEKALSSLSLHTHLTMATDGEKLMDYLAQNPDTLPEVIFLDLNMPCINGAECLSFIRSSAIWQHIPVVIYSTSLHTAAANQLYIEGATYYLQKCSFAELKACLKVTLDFLAISTRQPVKEYFIIKCSTLPA